MIQKLLEKRTSCLEALREANDDVVKLILSIGKEIGIAFDLDVVNCYLDYASDETDNDARFTDECSQFEQALRNQEQFNSNFPIQTHIICQKGFERTSIREKIYLRAGDKNFAIHYGEIPISFFYSQNLKQDILIAKQAFIDWKADKEKKATENKLLKNSTKEQKTKLREAAKAKLTPEEREALGLR